jgi:ABC-type transport system involved in cytochrome bd biosynthesis fused ATPase/permease subunit
VFYDALWAILLCDAVLLITTYYYMSLLQDVPLFLALLRDTFTTATHNSTSSSTTSSSSSSMSEHLVQAAAALHYSVSTNPAWLAKALQLHDVLTARHAVAVVGTAGCGKTSMLTCLQGTLSTANEAPHRRVTINPKVSTGFCLHYCIIQLAQVLFENKRESARRY